MTFPNSQSNPAAATPVWIAPAPGATHTNITTATDTLVKTGAGTFLGFTVNTGGAGSSMAVYDGISGAGILLGTFSTATQISLAPNWSFATGLFITTAGGTPADITVASL